MATPCSPTRAHRTPQTEEAYIPPESEATTINAVALQYFPRFNREEPKLWFIQVEAALRTRSILETPPTSNKYETLNDKLLELYGKSEGSRVRQLLRTCRMGDEKPSHFLQRM
ncbi:hypothetical protein K0M31_002255 [Melipona bicolor]|uniref:Uncharacterized protein n=1 Tax=Melipona bicolor TaxID=60889 RepID=A0AA40GH67_9HYME|nr:hypothetical protein K0M31_002255 [Melipona bicolor]